MSKSYAIPISIVISAVIIGGAIFATSRSDKKESGLSGNVPIGSGTIEVAEDDDPMLGNPLAPVTFINFGDFRCQFCAKFQKEIKPMIIEKYVKTGKVKYIYRDLITMGENSILASGGANCAGEQGKYWEFADYMHSGEAGHSMTYTEKSLADIALSLGLDKSVFEKCLTSDAYIEEVKKDTEDAMKAGADGTPTVFINGRIISGINPIEVYESIIEEELLKK